MIKYLQQRKLTPRGMNIYPFKIFRIYRIKHFFATCLILLSVLSLLPIQVLSANTQTINYQSRLFDASGNPVTTTISSIQFSLYNHSSNGNFADAPGAAGPLLWKETYDQNVGSCLKVTPDNRGYYTVQLGNCAAFPSYINFNEPVYLGVRIAADAEATPRVLFGAHPYARNSETVNAIRATGTAAAGQLLALDANLNFNISTGSFAGASFNMASTTATSTIGGDLSVSNLLKVIGNSYFGTISAGVWQGTAISAARGGTAQDSSGWTGFAYVNGGVWSASSTISSGLLPTNVMLEGENISLLNNNAGFITSSSAENLTNKTGNISMWINDLNFVTSGQSWNNLNFGNATGTNQYLSGILNVAGNSYFGTISSGTWNGGVVQLAYGGTGTSTIGPAGTVVYSNGTTYAFTSTGTIGRLLQANASGTPTWISTSSLGISINDVSGSANLAFLNGNNVFTGNNSFTATTTFTTTTAASSTITNLNANSLVANSITLGGVTQNSWPIAGGGGSWWATSSNSLVGYPGLAAGYAIVVGGNVTSTNAKLEVIGNENIKNGILTVSNGSVTSSLANNYLILGQDATHGTGYFYVDSSGNIFSSGTLRVSDNAMFGNITSGTWQGNIIQTTYGGTGTTTIGPAGSVVYSNGTSMAYSATGTIGYLLQANAAGAPTWVSTSSLGFVVSESDPVWMAASTSYALIGHSHTSTSVSGLTVSDFATNTISQWINDSGYITSSALIGFITDGNTNWDNSYGFITSSSAENLTNKTGNISMWINDLNFVTSGQSWNNLNFGNATGTNQYLSGILNVAGNSYFGTISSGTWNGGVIQPAYGGTGQNSSGWTGLAYVNGGVWSSTSTLSPSLLASNIMLEGENISLLNNNAGYITSSALANYLVAVSTTARLTGNGTTSSPLDIAQQGAVNGQVMKWNGSTWAPANDEGGASSTAYTAGDGLSLVGTEFRVRINSAFSTSSGILSLATSSVAAGDYGSSTGANVPYFTVDQYGRVSAGGTRALTYTDVGAASSTHTHTSTTISGLTVSNFASQNISQWTNDMNFVTSGQPWTNLNFSYATGTNLYLSGILNVAGNSYFGTIASGTWQGRVIGTAYGGTGTSTLGPSGSVAYSNGTSLAYASSLFWDAANGRLGVNTTTPSTALVVSGTSTMFGHLDVDPTASALTYTAHFSNSVAEFYGNANSYLKLDLQNRSTGNSASGDFVATANDGTDTTYFIDMGIKNSSYSSSTSIFGAHDGYLYTSDGSLMLGAASSTANTSSIKFFTGGMSTSSERMVIDSTGRVGINVTNPTAMLTVHAKPGIDPFCTYDVNDHEIFCVKYTSSQLGTTVAGGAFIGFNSNMLEEFIRKRNDFNNDQNGVNGTGMGDGGGWGVYEEKAATDCRFSSVDDSINGVFRIQAVGGDGGCLSMVDQGNNLPRKIVTASNYPIFLGKFRPSVANAFNRVFVGFSTSTDGNSVNPDDFIGFTNNGGTWAGLTAKSGASTTIDCVGQTINTSSFAVVKVEALGTTTVQFFVDNDVSDGVTLQSCGTSTTNIPTVQLAPEIMYQVRVGGTFPSQLDTDFFRMWQDDSPDAGTADAPSGLSVDDVSAQAVDESLLPSSTVPLSLEEQVAVLNDFSSSTKQDLASLKNTINLQEQFNTNILLNTDKLLTSANALNISQAETKSLLEQLNIKVANLENHALSVDAQLTSIKTDLQLFSENASSSSTVTGGNINANLLVVSESALFNGEIIAKKHITFNVDTAGQVKIPAGSNSASVVFVEPYQNLPIVIVTPIDFDGKWKLSGVSTSGFKVLINNSETIDTIFNWHAFGSVPEALVISASEETVPEEVTVVPEVVPAGQTTDSETVSGDQASSADGSLAEPTVPATEPVVVPDSLPAEVVPEVPVVEAESAATPPVVTETPVSVPEIIVTVPAESTPAATVEVPASPESAQ